MEESFRNFILAWVQWGFLKIVPDLPEFVNVEGRNVQNVQLTVDGSKYGVLYFCDNGPNIQGAFKYYNTAL